jgi:Ca2+-binding RTX toxin-like protein
MCGHFKKLFIISLIVSLALIVPGHQVEAQLSIDLSGIQDIIDNIGAGLDKLINSKPLDKLENSGCLASGLTGGESGIKKKGHLIIGTNCDDKIKGDGDDEIIYTLGGVDRVFAGKGNDIIYGGLGDDRLYGERDDDIIMPGSGSNLLDGGPGNDILFGGLGNNLLVGGDGNDQLIAGIGTTIMDGGPGSNGFDCGGSSIVLDYNPDNGDTVAGKCKIVNNVGIDFPSDIDLPG